MQLSYGSTSDGIVNGYARLVKLADRTLSAWLASRALLPSSDSKECQRLRLILNQRLHIIARQLLTAGKEFQLDHKHQPNHCST